MAPAVSGDSHPPRRTSAPPPSPSPLPRRRPAQAAFDIDLDVHCNRGGADLDHLGVEAHDVVYVHRRLERKGVDRDRHGASLGAATGGDGAGDVHLRHDPAAEDVAGGVGVLGHRHQPQGGVAVGELNLGSHVISSMAGPNGKAAVILLPSQVGPYHSGCYTDFAVSPGTAMSKVENIEHEIQGLSASELSAFRRWFVEFDAKAWERQIEEDARAGKLDAQAEAALKDHKAGKSTAL